MNEIPKEISDYFKKIGSIGGTKSKGGGRPKKYHTEEERLAAIAASKKKYRLKKIEQSQT